MTEQTIKGWLTESYDYKRPSRGQIREGVILKMGEQGAIIDVDLKRDGFVPRADIERLGEDAAAQLAPGQEVTARIMKPEDRNGNLILSLYQALSEKDWDKAQELLDAEDIWRGQVTDYNKGGLIVKFHRLRGFIPGSHLWKHKRSGQREETFKKYVGEELPLKVIEVHREKNRLIMSERLARRKARKQRQKHLLEELVEGQVYRGTVSQLCDFGAFVDLGGADGLVHISELSWRRVGHPKEVLEVGQEIDVYVLRLDHERKRISLSLKRLEPNPWDLVDGRYVEGQLVSGTVTNTTDFGAFVRLGEGVDGLIHISELASIPPEDPKEVVQRGEELVLRILRIDSVRHRIALSLKRVTPQERGAWMAQRMAEEEAAEEVAASVAAEALPSEEEQPSAEAQEEQPSAEEQPSVEAQEEQPSAEAREEQPGVEAQEEQPSAEAQEEQPSVKAQEKQPSAEAQEEQPDAEAQEQEQQPDTEREEQEGTVLAWTETRSEAMPDASETASREELVEELVEAMAV